MSLRKSPTMTPARLQANRRNAQKSTGPRTARGKAQSRMNSLKNAGFSPLFRKALENFLDAPPGAGYKAALATLTPEQAAHPVFARELETIRWAETGEFEETSDLKERKGKKKVSIF